MALQGNNSRATLGYGVMRLKVMLEHNDGLFSNLYTDTTDAEVTFAPTIFKEFNIFLVLKLVAPVKIINRKLLERSDHKKWNGRITNHSIVRIN